MSTASLDQLGIQYRLDNRDEDKVKSILLPFTAEQFVDICNRESSLLPMCCSAISAMRDIITGSLRDGGWLEIEKLETLIQLMRGHDFENLFQPTRVVPAIPDPWLRLVLAWEALADCAVPAYPHNPSRAEDPTDLRDACYLLSNGCYRLWVKDLFYHGDTYSKERYPNTSEEELASRTANEAWQHAVDKVQVLLRAVPALHTLYNRIQEAYPEPVEGWCAVLTARPVYVDVPDTRPGQEGKTQRVLQPDISTDPFGHGIILVSGGLAIYRTPEKLEQAIGIWETQRPTIREGIVVKRVRVSVADGIQILGDS